MEQWKAKWTEHWLKLAVIGFFSLMVLLFNQQNTLIAGQKEEFKESCTRMEKAIDGKVDNKVMLEMIKAQNLERKDNRDRWNKQDVVNEKLLESVQDLNENVLLLNEKMK